MSNHLGNVMAVVSDNRLQIGNTYVPDVINSNDYYAFGGQMPGRDFTNPGAQAYRYGFNGKENDNEVKGAGNQQDYSLLFVVLLAFMSSAVPRLRDANLRPEDWEVPKCGSA